MLGFVILLSVPLLIYLFKVSPEKRAIKSGKEGEKRVSRILRRHGFRVFDDLIFKENGRTVQIDHIAVSDSFMLGHRVTGINEWNYDKTLSDHKGIVVQID